MIGFYYFKIVSDAAAAFSVVKCILLRTSRTCTTGDIYQTRTINELFNELMSQMQDK